MRTRLRLPAAVAMAAMLLLTSGCGAGLITGVVASSGRKNPEARVPELSLSPLLPLVPAPNTTRTIIVANAQIAAAAAIKVRIEANNVAVDQPGVVASGQGGSTLITFTLDTAAIVQGIADPTAADVPGTIRVLVDDRAIAGAAPIVLARQPAAGLLLPQGVGERFVSPLGERVSLRVRGLRSTSIDDLQLLVTTRARDASGPSPTVTRAASDLRFEADDNGVPVVSGLVPGNTYPQPMELVLRDAIAGTSTTVDNAYYRPDINIALPGQGSTTGGSLLTLIGTAMVPFDQTTSTGTAPLLFADARLSFAKGGRVTALAAEDFRTADSSSDRLVFTMPASPDGRPGNVDIVLRVTMGSVVAEVTANLFLYANPDPFFGPRGTVLERLPIAVAPIALDSAPSLDAAPDFAALTEQGGVGFLQLLLAQQNGMFQRFAAPQQIGDHEVAAERGPQDLCVGDFDGDHVPDVLIVNEGAATAVHHLLLGQLRPLPPLGAVHRMSAAPGTWRCRSALFDGDELADVLMVPGPNKPVGQRPEVWLARPTAIGSPAFSTSPLDVRDFHYEAVEVADLDGDGHLDIALVSGTEGKLDVAYGLGDGTFTTGVQLDFTVPGYTFDPASPAVGLHACQDGPPQSLALVLSGLLSSFGTGPTQPTVAVLRQVLQTPALPTFLPPTALGTVQLPVEPIGRSLAADIDQSPPIELVIAMRDEPLLVSLALLQLGQDGFVAIDTGVEFGTESPRQIRALVYDRAFPATPLSDEARAVFIVHETVVDGERERRLSTRLVVVPQPQQLQQPLLLPPDAGAQVGFPIEGLVGGDFHAISIAGAGVGAVRDLALAHRGVVGAPDDEIVLVANDGFGGFPRRSNRLLAPGLLPSTMTLLPSPAGQVDRLIYLGANSQLFCWRHDPYGDPVINPGGDPTQFPTSSTLQLRTLISDPLLSNLDLSNQSRLLIGDVDGDGIDDLVALLRFELVNPGEGQARIAVLRGKAAPAENEFPFEDPVTLTAVHGNASSIALGDFVNNGPGMQRRLELAVAVPVGSAPGALDGDHVRFYRYSSALVGWQQSAVAGGAQVLLAGSEPTQITAGDFDHDGRTDLLVACSGDNKLRWFRNTAPISSTATEVDVLALVEDLASPRPLPPGTPTLLRLADINGDGSLDVIAFVEDLVAGQRTTAVAKYISSSTGEFDGPAYASPTRIGNRDAVLIGDLGDWNRDGVVDLFLGWNTSGASDRNLRVLFGGTR